MGQIEEDIFVRVMQWFFAGIIGVSAITSVIILFCMIKLLLF